MSQSKTFINVALLCLVVAAGPINAQTDVSHCDVLITKGLKEHSINTSSESNLNIIYDNECTASGSRKSTSAGLGLKAIIDEIPAELTGSYTSAEDAMSNFCKNYHSTAVSNKQSYTYKEKIVATAYDSYNQCVAFSLAGVRVDHNQVSLSVTSFYLTPSVNTAIEVSGLKPSANVTCQGQNPITNQLITYDPTTHFKSTKPFNIACTRKSTQSSSGQIYDEGSVTIETNISNYDVYIPPDEIIADKLASDLQRKIDDNNKSIANLDYTIDWFPKDSDIEKAFKSSVGGPTADPPPTVMKPPQTFGRFDICEIVKVDSTIVGGEIGCSVNPPTHDPNDPNGDYWTLQAHHNASTVGTNCYARCGRIVKSNPTSSSAVASKQ
jgi:hypothetical protein